MCMLSNTNILHSLHSACYYFQYWREIPPCYDFYIVTRSYSSSYVLLFYLCLTFLSNVG